MPGDVVDEVMVQVRKWSETYRGGAVRLPALIKPRLEDGEKWSTRVLQVGSANVRREEVAGFRSATSFNPDMNVTGVAFATDRRLFVATLKTVKREWRWSDLHSVVALDDFQGVVLDANPDTASVDVIATHRTRTAVGPGLVASASSWLRVEGTFADFRGDLDGWMAGVSDRLRAVYPG